MKYLQIKRFKNIDDGTIGKFELFDFAEEQSPSLRAGASSLHPPKDVSDFADKNKVKGELLLSGYTLEPAGDDCITPGRDLRIPQGKYEVSWDYSPRFGRVLATLFNDKVSKTRRILIHAGNYPKDTLGCILLGSKYDDRGVYESKKTLEAFMQITKNKPLQAQIINLKDV